MKRILLALMMMVSVSFAFTPPETQLHSGVTYYSPVYVSTWTTATASTLETGTCGNYSKISSTIRRFNCNVSLVQNADNSVTQTYMFYDYSTVYIPSLTCGANMTLNSSKTACTCNDGYNPDDVTYDEAGNITTINTCKPKKDCPAQMQYFWTDKATTIIGTQTEYAGCIPRTDLSEAECGAQGGTFYKWANDTSDGTSQQAKYMLTYGEGCVNEQYLKDNSFWDNFNLLMSGFILHGSATFPMALAKKAVTSELLALEYKQAGNGANLLTHEPEVIDLVMGADGVYAELGLTAKTASLDAETLQTFNQWLKDNGLFGKSNPGYEYPTNDLGIDSTVSSAMNNMYKGGDEVKFSDNILGASKIADKADSFASMDASSNIGATKTSTIDIASLLDNATTTKSYPVTSTVLEKTTSAAGEVTTKTASKINYPDGTYSTVTSLATKFADATTKYDITISTPIATTNGTKTIEQAYTVTKNATGVTTNKVTTKEPTITYTDSSGHTTTASNTSVDTATADKNLASPLDLTNIQTALNQMNKTLTETKELIKDLIQYKPANLTEFETSLAKFKNGFNDFSLKLDDFLNFIGGFPPLIDDLKNQLNDLLAMFDDKPSISLPDGQCPFPAHWYGKSFEVDPCLYVRPYRPILVVFLTFFASWVIFIFVFKFMFRVNLRGE